jgi:hypothetical protein
MRLNSMLDDSLTTFLQQGVAINIGTRNARLEPSAAYVGAALVDADRKHLTVFVPAVGAEAVLDDLQANGQAAIVFARPEDDRACQVKGTFVAARPASDAEEAVVRGQFEGFLRQLEIIGMPGESTRVWSVWPAIAVRLRVTAVFDQTPGPKAGAVIK